MAGLQGFIGQKPPNQPVGRRQVSDDMRVPVPPTRLEHPNPASPSIIAKPSQQNTFVHHARKSEFFRHQTPLVQASNDHHDGFDTDAEGLDDTTVTSTVLSTKDHQTTAPVTDGPGLPTTSQRQYTHDTFRSASLSVDRQFEDDSENNVDNQGMEDDEESYGDSGDGDDSEEEDGADHDRMPNNATLLNELKDPDFIRFCQQSEPLNKNAEYQKLLDSPSTRSIALRSTAKLNPNSADKIPSDNQSDRFGRNEASQQVSRQSLLRASTVSNQGVSLRSPRGEIRQLDRALSYQSPRLGQQMVPTNHVESGRSVSPALQNHNHNQIHDSNYNNTEDVDKGPQAHLQMLMPPPPPPKSTGQAKQVDHHVREAIVTQPCLDTFTAIDDDIDEDLSFTEKERVDEDYVTNAALTNNKRSRELDHNPDELSDMTYAQLRSEPFNIAPQSVNSALPEPIDKGTLNEKLEFLAQTKDQSIKKRQWNAFLASLSMEEYEKCGEIMVQQFTQIVSKFMDTRQQKRQMLTDFEDEIGKREQRVRGKAEAYQKHFSKLKRGGEDVVKQKMDL